ncbi:MAG: serine/threonine protein kinase [Verrucomicrobiales bacterium]
MVARSTRQAMTLEDHQPCPRCGSELADSDTHGLCARCVVAELLDPDDAPAPEPLGEFGNYEILSKIAAGGMGVVYRAKQKGLDRIVALKLIPEGRLAGDKDIERFLLEARAAAELEHPNIVPIYEVGEADGQPFFTMRFVDSGDLSDWIDAIHSSGKEVEFRENLTLAVRMMVKIARAIEYAHSRNIIHRDLKPPNILVDHHGEPQITDFGIAKRLGSNDHLTLTGQALGSPAFMAPEQSSGGEPGPTTDVYGLGVILYQMLSGELPFSGKTPLEVIKQAAEVPPKRLRDHNRQIDEELEIICLKCLEKLPEDRFESAATLADDLSRWLAGEPILARPLPQRKRVTRWASRNRTKVTVGTSISLLLVVAAVYISLLRHQEGQQRSELYTTHIRLAADEIAAKELNWRQSAESKLAAAADYLPTDSKPIEWKLLSGQIKPPVVSSGSIPQSDISGIAVAQVNPLYLSVVTHTGTLSAWAIDDVRRLREQDFPVQEPMPYYNGGGETLLVRNSSGDLKTVGEKTLPDLPFESPFVTHTGSAFASTEGTAGSKIVGKIVSRSGKPTAFEVALPKAIQSLAIDGQKFLAFACYDHVEVWDVAEEPPKREAWVNHHFGTTLALDFASNGLRFATGTVDGTVRVWQTRTGNLEGTFRLGTDGVAAVAFVEQQGTILQQSLVAMSHDGNFKVWDLLKRVELVHPILNFSPPLALSADSQYLVGSRSTDGPLGIANFRKQGLPLQELSVQGEPLAVGFAGGNIQAFVKTKEGLILAKLSPDGGDPDIVHSFSNTDEKVGSVSLGPDGKYALVLVDDLLRTIDCDNGETLSELAGFNREDQILAVSADFVAIGSRDSLVRLFSYPANEAHDVAGRTNATHAAFSADGTRLALVHENSVSTFSFNNETWKKHDTHSDCQHPGPVAWSSDNQTLIIGDLGSLELIFFGAVSGDRLYPLETRGDWKQVTCTRDGRHIVAATSDKVFVISVPMSDDATVRSKPK